MSARFPAPDPWQHDVWVKAWERNAPLIVSDRDYRIPSAPPEMTWLLTRHLIKGKPGVELRLLRAADASVVSLSRADSDEKSVVACAQKMVKEQS